MNVKYRNAMPEILEYLKYMDYNDRSRISNSFIVFLKENADYSSYNSQMVDYSKSINEINFSKEAKIILTFIYYRFLCKDEKQKQELVKILNENQINYDKELSDKYSYEKLFQNSKRNNVQQNSVAMITEEEANKSKSFFSKIINYFKRLFKKK